MKAINCGNVKFYVVTSFGDGGTILQMGETRGIKPNYYYNHIEYVQTCKVIYKEKEIVFVWVFWKGFNYN